MTASPTRWQQIFQQIKQKIDILKNLVEPLPGKDIRTNDEQRQINQPG